MRVLLIEDEPDLQRALWSFLEDEGYAVDAAADGETGLAKGLAHEYDVIVLDVMLPRRDGWSVLEELRKVRQTPVLLLTARDAVQDRVHGLNLGADDYLVKPFELDELAARLRALIRRSAGLASSTIVLDEIIIDLTARRVTKEGQEVHLTATEFALLQYLAVHRGRLVTRAMLYDHLFDEYDESLSNLIEVHMSNVRRKLRKDLIVTRRGLGYMIDAHG